MAHDRAGVGLSTTAAKESRHQMGDFNLACAAIEALTRSLAGEVGRQGVRVVGIRPGMTDDDVPQLVKDTLIDRLPRLAEVGIHRGVCGVGRGWRDDRRW